MITPTLSQSQIAKDLPTVQPPGKTMNLVAEQLWVGHIENSSHWNRNRQADQIGREDSANPAREVGSDANSLAAVGVGCRGDAVTADDKEEWHADPHPFRSENEPRC